MLRLLFTLFALNWIRRSETWNQINIKYDKPQIIIIIIIKRELKLDFVVFILDWIINIVKNFSLMINHQKWNLKININYDTRKFKSRIIVVIKEKVKLTFFCP